ncbi:berberine bridge enzyme-like 22 [Euphorbia lathyris]|uniref:berberine bridge enzyme-like 22 n=1 Tax=Euphorbia lathyris TaxID=212925 RepID=UPI0033134FE3
MKHIFIFILLIISCANSIPIHKEFYKCISTHSITSTKSIEIIFTPESSLYSSLLKSSQQNLRWINSTSSNPLLIITPFQESEIQAAIICSRTLGLQLRVRSGGHDYEGLSYLSQLPFVLIDLINFGAIEIDMEDQTAWVQSGATIGQLYYAIAKKSGVHGFPAGLCPTVGVGGHFSGGGFGTMVRKYGVAADNVVDAYLIDVHGRILDRKGMGEDLFWAIRGGGGASFGVILSWKINLVQVPQTVTVFAVTTTFEFGATKLIHKWQHIADKVDEDLFIRIIMQNIGDGKGVQVIFNSLFLGGIERVIPLMNEKFPELEVKAENCSEMSWVESTVYFAGFPNGSPVEVLLDKTELYKASFKAKSDFVTIPISEKGVEGIVDKLVEEEVAFVIMDPYGGRMSEISESEIAFPHRKGVMYNIQYLVKWEWEREREEKKHIKWIRCLHRYMKPYVSRSPRTAYLNYRDLDLGRNKLINTSYAEASVWGIKYFKGNFKRLVQVKTKVDPHNFFRNDQSIPSLK